MFISRTTYQTPNHMVKASEASEEIGRESDAQNDLDLG